MKRVFESSTQFNFGLNLNYVPYRQKDQFLSPQFSAISKRSSISFRSPSCKNKNKFSLKEIKPILPNLYTEPENQQTDVLQPQFDSPVMELNEKVSCSSIQEQQNNQIPQTTQESKLEESVSLATDLQQEQKSAEVFPLAGEECQICSPPQQQNSQNLANQTEIVYDSQPIEDKFETPTKIKGIIKTPESEKLSAHIPIEPKKVSFAIPPPEEQLQDQSSLNNVPDAKPKDKFADILKNLKNKNKNLIGQKGKKEGKQETANSKLLMRFKKK